MTLSPITTASNPRYPSRHRVFAAAGAWLRRAATAAAASSAFALGACYGATALGPGDGPEDPTDPRVIATDEPPGPFEEVVVRMDGAEMAPSFVCGATRPDPMPHEAWGWGSWGGSLCGEDTAWAVYDVSEGMEGRHRLSLAEPAEFVQVTLLDRGGAEVAVVDPSALEAEADLTAGTWTLAASALDPAGHGSDGFSVSLSRL